MSCETNSAAWLTTSVRDEGEVMDHAYSAGHLALETIFTPLNAKG